MRPTREVVGVLCAALLIAACAGPRSTPIARAPEPVPDKLVVLTFDDAVRSHFTTVAPLLKRYGFGATFFVTEFPEPPFSDTTLYMTWAQIGRLNEMGFEVGNHTWKHTHVTRMDRARFIEELKYVEDKSRSLGAPTPVSFAYPAYRTSDDAVRTLRERGYRFARIGGGKVYDPARDDPLLIPSFTTLANNRDEILGAFQHARDGRIVVLTIHGVPDTAHPWVNTPVALFEEYLAYLRDNNYRVIAMRDMARYVAAPVRTDARDASHR